MNLKKYLQTPLQRPLSKHLLTLLFVIAALGFLDATYLTIEHFMNAIPPCSIGSCETVLTSSYATFLGVPVALGGALFYFLTLVLLMLYRDSKKEFFLRLALILTIPAFIATLYFFFLQAFVLKAFCIYCLGSAATSTALFISALYIFKKYRTPIAA